ncbi:MAG: GDP-mannose 4,6-dehydratase, partial [Chloroflexota bacterium]
LTDADRVREILEGVKPNWIFHLAAQAFVPTAFADPTGTLVNNIVGQVNLLQSILTWEEKPTVVVICSNEEYGMVAPEDLPLRETAPFRPANPYAVSKVAQDMLGYQYHVAYGLPIVRIRPFNHIGPGQSDRFVASSFARQIAEAELGLRHPVLQVGNLEAERDYSDVRDIVRGYRLAALHGAPGDVYNLGSERAVSTRHLLDLLLTQSRVQMQVEQDPSRLRPADIPRVVADCSKFRALTGWRAEIPLEQTLADTLAYWRETLRK